MRHAAIIAALLSGPLLAQRSDLRTFSLEEGLPSAHINALCAHADGFLRVAVKGRGELQLFFVDRLRYAWSEDGVGRLPNKELLAWRPGHLTTPGLA